MITARKVQKAFFGAYRFGTNKVFIVAEPIKCLSYRNILASSGRDASLLWEPTKKVRMHVGE